MDKKKLFRKRMKQRLNQIPQHTYEQWSHKITHSLVNHPYWREAKTIGITISMPREVNTQLIIEQAWLEGKRVVIPKCIPSERKMTFHSITNYAQIEEAFAGLYEPIPQLTTEVHKNDIDLLIVPGLCFDSEGFRLGFGGGYYDRFLEGYANQTIALAFEIQVLSYIPTEKFDLHVSSLITNEGVRHFD